MSVYDGDPVYWGEIPVGATIIVPAASKPAGQYYYSTLVVGPSGAPTFDSLMVIHAEDIPLGLGVYVSQPTAGSTEVWNLAYRIAEWGTDTNLEIKQEIDRVNRDEPLRCVVPHVLTPNEITTTENWDKEFPQNCYVVLCRKEPGLEGNWWAMWRRWMDPSGQQCMVEVDFSQMNASVPVYMRVSFLEFDDPIGDDAAIGQVFLPVVWSPALIQAVNGEMNLRVDLTLREKIAEKVDYATYRANQVAAVSQVAIMAINPDKRRSAGQWSWSAFIAWALYGSKQKVNENEARRLARMR